MEQFLQYTVSGLSTGGIYSLVALGLALIYRSTRILNFAHGDITTIGTLVAFTLIGMKVPFAVAAVLALLFGAGLAMAFYFCVLVPAQRRDATQLGQIILTLGLGLIIQGVVSYTGGDRTAGVSFPIVRIQDLYPRLDNHKSVEPRDACHQSLQLLHILSSHSEDTARPGHASHFRKPPRCPNPWHTHENGAGPFLGARFSPRGAGRAFSGPCPIPRSFFHAGAVSQRFCRCDSWWS